MEPVTIALLLSGAFLLRPKKKGGGGGGAVTWNPKYANRQQEQAQIFQMGRRIEAMGILPGFAYFLIPCAFIESRFNPAAQNGTSPNAARGWFGMRPESAFNWKNGLTHLATQQPNLLKNKAWAVAMAADYTYRLIRYNTRPGQKVTWKDIRRGWGIPSRTGKATSAQIASNAKQFANACEKTGMSTNLMSKRVTLGNWPKAKTGDEAWPRYIQSLVSELEQVS